MNKNYLRKCFLSFGLFLFITLLMPFTPFNVISAQAANVDTTKSDSYKLNLKSVTIVKGKTLTLKVYNTGENAKVIYKSDDEEVASVGTDGLITANKIGMTNITAIVKDGANSTPLTCEVIVGPAAFSVKITKSRIVIGLDKTDFLNVIMKPSNTVEVARFSSFDSSIASVSTGGRITARKLGLTYLFAEIDATDSVGNRKYSRCTVIVTSQDNASLLESYLADHPELDLISEDDLTKALDEFFNVKYDPTSSTSLVSSLNRYLEDKFKISEYTKRSSELNK